MTPEKEWDPEDIFEVFSDTVARQVLVVAAQGKMSADDLAERLDTSLPTIYRRVNALIEYDLLTEDNHFDEDGNHYKTFETSLKRISFEVTKKGYLVNVQMDRDLVDQFQQFWSDLDQPPEDRSFTIETDSTDAEDGTHIG